MKAFSLPPFTIKAFQMNVRVIIATLIAIAWSVFGTAQTSSPAPKLQIQPFIAYEFVEAIFNKFRSLSGEVGVQLPNKHMIRLVHQNIKFTEEHLSSGFAVTVKGDDVEGSLFGFEVLYSLPLVKWRDGNEILFLSPSVGYYRNRYNHTIIDAEFEQRSPTIGLEISYRETNLFGLKGFYYAVTIPIRIHFKPHDAFYLGETKVLGNRFDNNIWFFIGYQFGG